MNREQIIQMARDAGAFVNASGGIFEMNHLEKFAAAIRAATKEEDAKICEEDAFVDEWRGMAEAARRIRASKGVME